jgi:hypothetical protein
MSQSARDEMRQREESSSDTIVLARKAERVSQQRKHEQHRHVYTQQTVHATKMFQLRGNGSEGVFSIKLNSSFRALAALHETVTIEFLTPGRLLL